MHPQSIMPLSTHAPLYVSLDIARELHSLPAAVLYEYIVYHGDGEPGGWSHYAPDRFADDLALTEHDVDMAATLLEATGWIERDGPLVRSVIEAGRPSRVIPPPYKRQRFSARLWREKLEAYGYACAYCGVTGRPLVQEHVIPLQGGGPDTWENIVPACTRCNHQKGTEVWTPRPPNA